jgi:Fe-S cluster assembly iron-binding protein IscA
MLTLTENATMIVKSIADQPDAPESTALRIVSEGQPESSFAVSTATQPEPDDQVVEQNGATVYLEPTAASQLDDKVLDAGVDEAGNVQFSLGQQA